MAKRTEFKTIGEKLYWSYSNLAMAQAAVKSGEAKYGRLHFIIRSKLYQGLMTNTMNIGSIYDDERIKMIMPNSCSYCGSLDSLSLDHIISRKNGGSDSGDNLVLCCKSCNSSKNKQDLMIWMAKRETFPPLLILRRYLKLVIDFCVKEGIMDDSLENYSEDKLPFSIAHIPTNFPHPVELRLHIK